jgi:hypothetical protein
MRESSTAETATQQMNDAAAAWSDESLRDCYERRMLCRLRVSAFRTGDLLEISLQPRASVTKHTRKQPKPVVVVVGGCPDHMITMETHQFRA